MASSINAKTSGAGGVVTTADNSGVLDIQSGGTTVATVNSSGVDVTGNMSVNGNNLSSQPSFRNLIINGDMRIAQRGTSSTGQSGVGGGYRTIDRFAWQLSSSMGTWTQEQSTDAPIGFSYSLKHTCTTAATFGANNDAHQIFQRIEGQNLQHLNYGSSNAKTITVSFWVKSNLTGTYTVALYGNNGSSTRQIGSTVVIDSANTWEKKTVTFVGDTVNILQNNNGQGLNLTIWLACGSNRYSAGFDTSWVNYNALTGASPSQTLLGTSVNDYLAITGVQLEVGSTATEFEHRPYDVELSRCQRYYVQYDYTGFYETIFMPTFISSANTEDVILYFPVEMRSSPNISHNGVGNFRVNVAGGSADEQCNGITASQISRQKARFAFSKPTSNMTIGQAGFINTQEGNDASLYISAEL